ncbi:MAG: tetratricopeptide repeat protein [Planctomycetes bacterium]|nr:tetratricopeptide repeat protein [Planctomycetota bacterium]
MSWLSTVPLWLLLVGGDHERGLQLYRDGKFAEAVQAFRAAIEADGDSPELQWNLALAHFAAGQLGEAETAVEKYAALLPGARSDLHLGMLGAVRLQQARTGAQQALVPGPDGAIADPLPELEKALTTCREAVDYYERALLDKPAAELRQGLERAQRLAQALAERIEELKKQQKPSEEKKPDEDGKQPDEKKPEDEKKPDEKKSGEGESEKDEKKPDDQEGEGESSKPDQAGDDPNAERKPGEAGEGEPGEGEQKPSGENRPPEGEAERSAEPEGNGAQPQPGEAKPEAGESKPREPGAELPEAGKEQKPGQDAPKSGVARSGSGGQEAGDEAKPRQLSPEQLLRLQETLRKLEEQARAVQARGKSGRRPVERDW